ncbi:sulfatase-like hydrolase/transferase [Panacibacter sp. DH6]|uniref:Sulfatase-like hydrolase/transferase n=1 Tax=Panacibacter microcysteis TaxID=2793269 RepID=A0A931GZG2_9BACT|nr:sulfatase-like hydrolase/transferase [Panacibacter microcysteis]MBG9378210.1 sulfatase-like hydrolase/transferase [Panacibacter microcysteis]
MRTYPVVSKSNISRPVLIAILAVATYFISCKKEFNALTDTSSSNLLSVAIPVKPNIVLILADDIGYEVPAVNGGQSYNTPNIDMMAAAGMRFTQCYGSPMCSPSRFMLLTGKYNFRNYTVWGIMDRNQRTIANMLADQGYDTYALGKWQLDGGDTSVKTFGFNSSYTIFAQYDDGTLTHDAFHNTYGRYKSPELYANGLQLGKSTVNKYCDDILVDSLTAYAARSSQQGKPFFIYYSTSLCHHPYSPTPDDPEYNAWDPNNKLSDSTFFPSMVQYMDKKIGNIFSRFDSMNLTGNTVFIFLGDNGTPSAITSVYLGDSIRGGKMKSTTWGTHVPLIVYWRGMIPANTVNSDLVDFTDFLPTLAGIARIPVPKTYGTIDGVSFAPRLAARPGTPRSWIFCHYDPEQNQPSVLKRWIQDTTYKLYDSTGRFYNVYLDPYEKNNLKTLTPEQEAVKVRFQSILDSLK